MRIVSYNILDGGEGRADPLAEVILAQRPDIVALVEADDATVVERIANRCGMDFIRAPGGKKGAALLSRWPIRYSIDHALLHDGRLKSLLEAGVIEPGGREWTVGVLHLHGRARLADEEIRLREIRLILRIFEEHRRTHRAHLLVGDFNANAPYQQIKPEQCVPATRDAWGANGWQIPRKLVEKLLDFGYADSLDIANPQQARTRGSFTTQYPGQRLDYIFTHAINRRRIRQAWIEQDRMAKYASDHFPIGAEID